MVDYKDFGNMMTKAITSMDNIGWGRSGALAGSVFGGTVGAISDRQSTIGGATKGAVTGFGAGKLLRYASSFGDLRTAAQKEIYRQKGAFAPGQMFEGADAALKSHAERTTGVRMGSPAQAVDDLGKLIPTAKPPKQPKATATSNNP